MGQIPYCQHHLKMNKLAQVAQIYKYHGINFYCDGEWKGDGTKNKNYNKFNFNVQGFENMIHSDIFVPNALLFLNITHINQLWPINL